MIAFAIVLSLFIIYLWTRQRSVLNAQKAEKLGVDIETVEEAVIPTSKSVYVKAAKDIGSGALDSARLAIDNTRQVVGEVKKDAKIAKLEALLGDDELMAGLKAKLAQEQKSE